MNNLLILLVILVAAALVVGGLYYGSLSSKPITTVSTSTILTSQVTTAPSTSASTSASTSTVPPPPVQNKTLSINQVISAVGTGWTAAVEHNFGPSNVTAYNNSKIEVQGYGSANFTNGGEYLETEWIQFNNSEQAANFVNATFENLYPKGAGTAAQTEDNATYYFYSGDSISNGQSASVIYGYYGDYGILMFNQGTAFPSSIAMQLLSEQVTNLGTSS